MSNRPASPFGDVPPNVQPNWQPPGYPPARPNQTAMVLAVGSLVTSVIGLLGCICCILLPVPLLSIILGAVALTQKPDQSSKIMAIVGITLSSLILIVFFGSMIYLALNPSSQTAPLFPINKPGD